MFLTIRKIQVLILQILSATLTTTSCFISVDIIARCMYSPHAQALSLAACYSDFMTGDSLSLPMDGINRLALQLVDVKPRRPAIIFTVVHLLWVNTGHLSGSGPSPYFLLPTTGGLLLYIYTLM